MRTIHKNNVIDTFFVKNGFHNGVEGEVATTSGFGRQLQDGWYYLLDKDDDGVGPHQTEQGATTAAKQQIDDILEINEEHTRDAC